MPKFDANDYLPAEAYREVLDVFHAVVAMLLLEFAREKRGNRDTIIRNFIARADMMTQAIFQLWDIHDYQDCWVLHRCLIDRLFHLSHLQQKDEFEVFEAWSFLEQYKAINQVLSDPEFIGARKSKLFNITLKQKKRARALIDNPPSWRRPKAEDAAKGLDMHFLYRFGYDFASTHVHPMANDGNQDFYTITKLEPSPDFPDYRSVLSNTLLVATILVQEALNASTLLWHALVYNFLDDFKNFLNIGLDDYKLDFLKLSAAFEQEVPLCQMPEDCKDG